ncbi:CPBP family glutamic-type intramembrane protease [Brackiella oedipodis]|uniref:CPBP family glutamic-type intramembrane protease n=1 Tax=Brackiella oedipodis TaxID=124225 RepID=UPI000491A295|nr:CPBP family glutamic-type intramembrane protease [Brackiella oedipodis]
MSATPRPVTFSMLWKDFIAFVKKPTLKHGQGAHALLEGTAHSWQRDWNRILPLGVFIKWLCLAWVVNLFLLAPLTFVVSQKVGAVNKITFTGWDIVLLAVLWAPLIEETVFRFILRRPSAWTFLIPLSIVLLLAGAHWYNLLLLALLLSAVIVYIPKKHEHYFVALSFKQQRRYVCAFPYILYGMVLLFAFMHTFNYESEHIPLWAMPFLVLPQMSTGMILAWLRVRFGILQSMLFHAAFNGGPVLLMVLLYAVDPELVN